MWKVKKESSFTVALSKFASGRLSNVLPITPLGQEVFVCKYDENIRLLLDVLNKVLPSVPKKPEDPSTCVFYVPVSLKGKSPVEIDVVDGKEAIF